MELPPLEVLLPPVEDPPLPPEDELPPPELVEPLPPEDEDEDEDEDEGEELPPPDDDDPPLEDVPPPVDELLLLPPVDVLVPPDDEDWPPEEELLPEEEPPPPFDMADPAVFIVEEMEPPSPASAATAALATRAANNPYSTLVTPRHACRRDCSFVCIAPPLCRLEGAVINRFPQYYLNHAVIAFVRCWQGVRGGVNPADIRPCKGSDRILAQQANSP